MAGRLLGWICVLAVAGAVALLPPAGASAHANLVRSQPAANQVVDVTPGEVRAWFSETIAPDFSELTVLDESGEQVDNGDSRVEPDGLGMVVTLPELAPGTYTVVWRNLSTVDGHSRLGAFPFFLGVEPTEAALTEADEPPLLQSPAEPLVRWLSLLGALVLSGATLVHLAIWRPLLQRRRDRADLQPQVAAARRRLVLLAGGALVAGSVAHLWVQAAVLSEGGPVDALGRPLWDVLESTQWGHAWLARLGFTAIAIAAVWALPRLTGRRREGAELLALAGGAGALASISAASHAYATIEIRTPAVAADFLHLVAASAWAGGLPAFLIGVVVVQRALLADRARPLLAEAAARFSLLASMSVIALVITGTYSAWAQLAVWRALGTPYGLALAAKLALVAALLAIGALNLLWVRPALWRRPEAARRLRGLVAAEVALVVLLLLATGLLTSMEPGKAAQSRKDAAAGLAFSGGDAFTAIDADLVPGALGQNELRVHVSSRDGRAVEDARVAVRVRYVERDLGAIDLAATYLGDGVYVADDLTISLAGAWQAEVVVERPDAFDARATSRFLLGGPSVQGAGALEATQRRGWQWATAALALLGIGLLGVGLLAGKDRRLPGGSVLTGGTAAIAAATLLYAFLPGDSGIPAVNPIPPDAASIEAGRALYTSNCAACHGETARGDGPAAAGLDPAPADLAAHVPLHQDRQLFGFIADGIAGTAMPPFARELNEEQIWQLLNYLRSLDPPPAE